SWVVSSLKKDYSARYKNYGGLEVFASFYPTSVLGDDDKKWGILIETPAAQIFAQKAKLRAVFLISAVLIGSLLIFLAFYILRNIARTERALAKQEEKTKMIVRQVAH